MGKPSENDIVINTCYLVVLALELMLREVQRRLEMENMDIERERKQNFNRFMANYKKTLHYAEQLSQNIYTADAPKKWKTIPVWQEESNELARLILLYSDKSADVDNVNKVFKLLRELPGSDIITEELLERFYLKKLNDE